MGRHLAVVPFTSQPSDAAAPQQVDLMQGEVSTGDLFVVGFGAAKVGNGDNDVDPRLFLHMPGATLWFSIYELIPQLYRGLVADEVATSEGDAWTAFERDPDIDRGQLPGYTNSVYQAWAQMHPGQDRISITLGRRDGQPVFRRDDIRRVAEAFASDLEGSEWEVSMVMRSTDSVERPELALSLQGF